MSKLSRFRTAVDDPTNLFVAVAGRPRLDSCAPFRVRWQALTAAGGDPARVDRSALVRRFLGQGASRSSLFNWVKAALQAGPLVGPIIEALEVIEAAVPVARAARKAPLPTAAGPAPPAEEGFERIIGAAGGGLIEAMDLCVAAARDVMNHSRQPDGSVRLGKSLLAASEHMRRVIETVARLQETMVSLQKIEAFYQALLEELRQESSDFQARVLTRLERPELRFRDA